jgi:hypothetical protein
MQDVFGLYGGVIAESAVTAFLRAHALFVFRALFKIILWLCFMADFSLQPLSSLDSARPDKS